MNNNIYRQPDIEIDLKEMMLDLLSQWKAVLLAAIIMAVLLAGAKNVKDMKEYNAALTEKDAETHSTLTAEEKIGGIINALPEEERATVIALVNQDKWIEDQKEYINNSILINSDPTNQRTLCLDYYITDSELDETIETDIITGYKAYLSSDKIVKSVGNAIDPEISSDYITELISVNNTDTSNEPASIFEVRIVLPYDAEADKVEKAFTKALTEMSSEVSEHICPHKISLVYSGERYFYNDYAVNKRTNILYSINNLQNNTKNMQASLSEGQRTAIESIKAIEKNSKTDINSEQESDTERLENGMTKPGISKKYAVLGFLIGAMLYAFAYMLLIILEKRVNYASAAENYSRARLVGELYKKEDTKGLLKLFYSGLVERYRYKGKTDIPEQVDKATDKLEAICKHEGTSNVAMIDLTKEGNKVLIKEIIEKALAKGVRLSPIEMTEDVDEKSLLSTKHAAFVIDSDSKISRVTEVAALCNDYDIISLGSIFIGAIHES